MAKKREKLVLLDGNALLHRAWHAIPPLTNEEGVVVNALYGFTSVLFKALADIDPTYIAVAFDRAEKTVRHEVYEDYKGTREKQDDELYDQIPLIQELLDIMHIPYFDKAGYEADDIIATIARNFVDDSIDTIILTGDLDLLQLVDDTTKVYTFKKGISDMVVYDAAAVEKRYGIRPDQIVDFKALKGDPSDNIPGVSGIGDKTASTLLQEYETLDGLYQALENEGLNATQRIQSKLEDEKEAAYSSKELVTVIDDVKIQFILDDCIWRNFDIDEITDFLRHHNFKSLFTKIPNYTEKESTRNQESVTYELVASPKMLRSVLKTCSDAQLVAFDTETTGLDPYTSELLGISLSVEPTKAYFIDFKETFNPRDDYFDEIKSFFADENVKKIAHNAKFDIKVLQSLGIHVAGLHADTMVAAYLLHAGTRSYALHELVMQEFGFAMEQMKELLAELDDKKAQPGDIPLERLYPYACADADYTLRLWHVLEPRLKDEGVDELFFKMEMPLVLVLAAMEMVGIKVDTKVLKKMSTKVGKEIESLQDKIYKAAGTEFNINSPSQMREILYDRLEIPTHNVGSTKSGYSTAASELVKIQSLHPIVPLIQQYRELAKLKSTYLDALPKQINDKTGRLHTTFHQTVAATGRLSSSDPNLQNIPTKTELGKKVREAFIPDPGYKLVSIDYSQVELRIAAAVSGDKTMIEAFKGGADIHTLTAAFIGDVRIEDVTPEMRYRAKEVNFGVLYGMGPYGLSSRTGISMQEAKSFIDKYFEKYDGVARYVEETKEQAAKNGYVETLSGRRRYLPEISSGMAQVRAQAERMAINFPLQGTSADIIKMAMVNVHNALADAIASGDLRILLQVHDELVFAIKEGALDQLLDPLQDEMRRPEKTLKLTVPLEVDVAIGDSWGEL